MVTSSDVARPKALGAPDPVEAATALCRVHEDRCGFQGRPHFSIEVMVVLQHQVCLGVFETPALHENLWQLQKLRYCWRGLDGCGPKRQSPSGEVAVVAPQA